MYGTGATVYGSENLTAWDSGGQIRITPMVKGLEETSVGDLISPPTGAPLISALGDLGGFRHTSLDAVPASVFKNPGFGSGTSLDYAESNANVVVRVGNGDSGHVGFSTDNGANWFAGSGAEPSGVTGGGTVAAASDGSRFVWSPAGAGVQYTTGFGTTWTAATGIPAGALVEADRKNPLKFYGYSGTTFYVSVDGGHTFTATAATGLPSSGADFKAYPGTEGDIWLGATGGGLWHSTNSGASFTKLAGITSADTLGFGKAAASATYQTIFLSARIGGVQGIYRSTDAGATWLRVNDDTHQWGWTGAAITGDPRVYGRVYVSTNGRGIVYGDTSDTSGGGSGGGTPPSTSACSVNYIITSQWTGGFQGDVTITNTGTTAWTAWHLVWTFPNGQAVTQVWNATTQQSGTQVTATNASHNGAVAAGASAAFGFLGSWTGTNGKPAAFTLDGATCAVAG
jgi:hypothetical protein